jgi:hypothetical protein
MNVFNIKNTFDLKRAKGWPEVYFCIDLHGTIIPSGKTSNDKTDALSFYPYAKEVLQRLSQRKDIIMILWTSTPVTRLASVWQFLNDNGIYFEYFNGNPHAKDTPRSDFSKKFYFNVLLDDRAGFEPDTDWGLIKEELIKIGEWNEKETEK